MTRRSANAAACVTPRTLTSRGKDRKVTGQPCVEISTLPERWLMDIFHRTASPQDSLCSAMLLRAAERARLPSTAAAFDPTCARPAA